MRNRTLGLVVGLVLGACVAPTADALVEPLHELPGTPLRGPTHLRLILAGIPPSVLDVDTGSIHRVHGVTQGRHAVLSLTKVDGGALALVDCTPCREPARAFLVKADASARSLAITSPVVEAVNAGPRWSLSAVAGYRIRVVDRIGGEVRVLRWPSILTGAGGALTQPAGRYVALTFADPAYPGPQQAEDLFLFDTRTAALTHVPGFPAQIDLKFSSMSWTSDGRLVLLLQAAGTTKVGIYRPGDPAVSLRRVQVPEPSGGSSSFVPLVVRS